MNAGNQRQEDAPSNPSIKNAVAALMGGNNSSKVVPAAPVEGGIKMYSQEYYMTCALGGVVSCGATHTAVTPLGKLLSLISSWDDHDQAQIVSSCKDQPIV
jgi:hypothetical protein